MKKLFILVIISVQFKSWGQTQELKQLSLDIEKLAQLKMILTQSYNGYSILESGYRQIKDISQGNYSLHKDFLDGMLTVSPQVRNYKKVGEVVITNITIGKEYKMVYAKLRQQNLFTVPEWDGIAAEYQQLIDRSSGVVTELYSILTPGELRMTDVERKQAIDRIAAYLNKQLAALRKYNKDLEIKSQRREQNLRDLKLLKQLF